MSYLLDALRDSQQQREGGPVPGLLTEHRHVDASSPPAGLRGRHGLSVLVLAVVIGGTAGWWFAVGDRSAPVVGAADSGSDVSEQPVIAGGESAGAAVPPPVVAQLPAANVASNSGKASDSVDVIAEAADSEAAPVVDVEAEEPLPDADVVATSDASLVSQMAADLEQRWGGDDGVPAEEMPATTMEEDVAVSEDDTGPASQSLDVPVESVPNIRQLPVDIQQQVDWIRFSVHLYASDPQRRMVKINGLVFREGSEVGNGVTVEAITPIGAIFVYGDHRFSVPVQ